MATVHVEPKLTICVAGLSQRSTLASPQVKRRGEAVACTAGLCSIVTHSAKLTFVSLSVSNRVHASPVFEPPKPVVSQLHFTSMLVGAPEGSTDCWVRSFWPGSSLAPCSSTVVVNAAEAGDALKTSCQANRLIAAATATISARRTGELRANGNPFM